MEYKPFAFPANIDLARLHSQASMPGEPDSGMPFCPCCLKRPKQPVRNWIRQDVEKDFQKDGGALTVYFQLLRFYAISILVIILMYSIMLLFQSYKYCQQKHEIETSCIFKFGLWIVSSQDVIAAVHDESRGFILRGLRTGVFIILLFLNAYMLLKVERFTIAQQDKSIEAYTLLFKHIDPEWMQTELKEQLQRVCPSAQVHEVFFLNKTDQYKKYFDSRNEEYFKIKLKFADTANKRQLDKMKKKKEKRDRNFSKHSEQASQAASDVSSLNRVNSNISNKTAKKLKEEFHHMSDKDFNELHSLVSKQKKLENAVSLLTEATGKAIIMFTKVQQRNLVLKHYQKNWFYSLFSIMGFRLKKGIYAEQMPSPNEVYWNYIGQSQGKKAGMIILEYITIIATLSLSYVLLSKGLDASNRISPEQQTQQDQGKVLNSTLIAIGVVLLGICFRKLMCAIAEWRKPETRTSKGLFIVATSIIFHLLYYAIIPTIYFSAYNDVRRSIKLLSIGLQVIFFLLIQFLLSTLDVFYCFWNRKKNKLLAAPNLPLCQKQLHQKVTCPTFPLQFKLMLLFKSWTFVLFYAFQLPYILILIFLLFVYLYVSDKHSVYTHYRPEHVGSRIQYTFLKIYSNFFTAYLCFFYCWGQHEKYELAVGVAVSALFILYQVFHKKGQKVVSDGDITALEEQEGSYRQAYETYLKTLNDQDLEAEIRAFLEVYFEEEQSQYTSSSEAMKRRADSLIVSDSLADMSDPLLRKNTDY